jgi:light-regulated signal transduction histidine kinase (bacteriophytochrome)
MDSLLRDIAAYCHGEGQAINSTEVRMNAVVGEAIRQAAEAIRNTGAQITRDELPNVRGDFFALATVFRNLIENACKFRREAVPAIHASAQRRGGEWVFFVKDNGLGFDPAHGDTVFQPLKRLHGKQFPGSGLGLATAKRIVLQHQGRIGVESTPGQGSTFWFSLPAPD